MEKYEKFLERVRDSNQDEFTDVIDILSRHEQLKKKKQELKERMEYYTEH